MTCTNSRCAGLTTTTHSNMRRTTNYLYIAQSQTDGLKKKYNVYKVGHSSQPLERIRALAGSASTETYAPILILALPHYVKDIHILSHRYIQQFVVHRHEELQSKYVAIFGAGHADGLKRRRELVMFGPRYAVSKIRALFRKIIDAVSSSTGTYVCQDSECLANNGASYCAVCTKFTRSLFNCIAYQKGRQQKHFASRKRQRALQSVETRLVSLLTHKPNRQQQWKGPAIGAFWILRPDTELRQLGYRYLIVRVLSNNRRARTSDVQEWSHSGTDTASLVSTLQTKFTTVSNTEEGHALCSNTVPWDQGEWQCVVYMRHFNSFCRMLNVSDVSYVTQQWSSRPAH